MGGEGGTAYCSSLVAPLGVTKTGSKSEKLKLIPGEKPKNKWFGSGSGLKITNRAETRRLSKNRTEPIYSINQFYLIYIIKRTHVN